MQFLAAEGTRSGAFERLLHRWRPQEAQAGGRRFHPDHMYNIYMLIHVPYVIFGYYICVLYMYMVYGLMCTHQILHCSGSLKLLSVDIWC